MSDHPPLVPPTDPPGSPTPTPPKAADAIGGPDKAADGIGGSQIDAQLQRELDEALGDKSIDQLMEEASAPPTPDQPSPEPDDKAAPGGDSGGASGGRKGKRPTRAADAPRLVHELARGRITAIRGDDVFVELSGLGGKNQGVVPLPQFERPPRPGSIMDFVIERFDEAEGLFVLSREGAISRATWDQLQRGAVVEARVVAANKGGLELEMVGGIRAFMPASQIDLHHVDDLAACVGQKLPGVVQEISHKHRKVVISRRLYLEQERAAKQDRIWEELAVGQLRDGIVSSVVEYGAFVDLGGIDGLVHVSDLSYTRVDKPSDMVKVGDTVKVKVLKLDKDKNRISLGIKQIAPDPWEAVQGRIKPGEQVSGKVLRIADFGAFVEVLPGVEGLLPVSEMSWKRFQKPSDVVKEGETIRLAVIQVDPVKKRLSLSLKQAAGDPWVGAEHKYAKNSLINAKVLSTTDFGAFLEIEPGVEGMVHISELSDRRVNAVTDVVKVGETYQVRVLEVDEDKRRIRLSIKAVKEPVVEAKPERVAGAESHPGASPQQAAKKPAPRKSTKGLKSGLGSNAALGMGLGDLKL